MAKNMYQKREERKNKILKNNEQEKSTLCNINWYIPTYGKTLADAYK